MSLKLDGTTHSDFQAILFYIMRPSFFPPPPKKNVSIFKKPEFPE
jgi:hypothetical protein